MSSTDPIVDTAQLGNTFAKWGETTLSTGANDMLGNLDAVAGIAKDDLHVNSSMVDNFVKTIRDLIQSIMSSMGMALPAASATTTTTTAAAPATTPSNPEAARAAALAAANANAGPGAHVTDPNGPATTPAGSKQPRAKA